ncbi:hypothetical protein NFI96_013184 [Prochilodus magdalenae]|nr:hypothetical protein NFI96_013184 [Prochilodus magdalenae]
MFVPAATAFPSPQLEADDLKLLRSFRSVTDPTAVPPEVRLHPGVVVSVVIVTVAAIAAAAFIIRKYCFPQSDATYRYSVLRQMEEHSAASREEDDSDEDLLE